MLESEQRDLQRHISALDSVFRHAASRHAAHEQSRPLLLDMAASDRLLTAVLAKHIATPQNLNVKNFPSLGFDVALSPHYHLVLNTFFPHPSKATDITCNAVHHHGELLLTTATTFGPGYEHWRFTSPTAFDPANDLFQFGLIDRRVYARGDAAFVDALMPHAVMFPGAITATYALWSNRHGVTWRDHAKTLARKAGIDKRIRSLAVRAGLKRRLGIRLAEYYDYHPAERAFCGMPERQQFARGPNADYLQSLFAILQATKNEALSRDIERQLETGKVEEVGVVRTLMAKLRKGDRIEPKFSDPAHRDVAHMNFKAAAITRTLERLSA
jgi:hypothetical protein